MNMAQAFAPLGYFCVGTLFGLAVMALVLAVARRRRVLDDALTRVYGPLHQMLGENAAARARVAQLEKKLMENYASESAPYSQEDKKAAAEAFLAAETRVQANVIGANQERMREIVAAWGHLLDDGDYLTLADEVARAGVRRAVNDNQLPKVLREPPPPSNDEAILEQIRYRFLALSGERRAGFFPALFAGIKHLFNTR